jgi:hypothetical protein
MRAHGIFTDWYNLCFVCFGGECLGSGMQSEVENQQYGETQKNEARIWEMMQTYGFLWATWTALILSSK